MVMQIKLLVLLLLLSSLFSLGFELYSRWVPLMICSGIWHKYHEWYFEIVIHNFTSLWTGSLFWEKKSEEREGTGGGGVASPETSFGVLFGHAFLEMKAWQRTPKDVCREAKESLDCFVIATLWSNRQLCADRKADVNQPCQQSVFSPIGPCIRIRCTAVANVCLQAFSLFPLPFFRSTKGLFTDYNFTSRSGEWN